MLASQGPSSSSRAATGCAQAVWAFGGRRRSRHPVLAHRPRPRRPLRRRRRRRRRRSSTARSTSSAYLGGARRLHRRLPGAAGGARRSPRPGSRRSRARRACWPRCRVGRPARGARPRRAARRLAARVTPPDLPLPFFALLVGAGIARLGARLAARRLRSPRSSSRRSPGPGTRTPQLFEWEPAHGRRHAPSGGLARAHERGPTTSCSATTRSSSGLGAQRRTSRGRAPARRRRRSRCTACSARAAARARRLGFRRERDEQLRAARSRSRCASPRPASAFEVARLRAVPRHPHPRARRDAAALPRGPARRCSRQARSSSATPTSTCRPSSAPPGRCAATARRSLALDELAVAGRLLEGGEPGGRLALPRLGRSRRAAAMAADAPRPRRPGTSAARARVLSRPWKDCRPCASCTLGDLLLDVIVRLDAAARRRARTRTRVTLLGAGRPGRERRRVGRGARRRGARSSASAADDDAGRIAPARARARRRRGRAGPSSPGRNGVVVSLVARGRRADDGLRPRRRSRAPRRRSSTRLARGLRPPAPARLLARCARRSTTAALRAAELARARLSVDLSSWSAIRDFGPERLPRAR